MGEFSYQFDESNKDAFRKALIDFNCDFRAYLEEQERIFSEPSDEQIKAFNLTLVNFQKNMRPDDAQDYMKVLQTFRGNPQSPQKTVTQQFLVFNYTNVFSSFYDKMFTGATKIGSLDVALVKGAMCPVHGTLSDGIILGCDNSAQYNSKLFSDEPFFMEKPQMNSFHKTGYRQRAAQIINSSNFFCIFGMSMGDTDLNWWENVTKQVLSNPNHRLIIFAYDEKFNKADILNAITSVESTKRVFALKSKGMDTKKTEDLLARTIVVFNMDNIFDIASTAS